MGYKSAAQRKAVHASKAEQKKKRKTKGYTQKNNPYKVTSCGRRRTYMHKKN